MGSRRRPLRLTTVEVTPSEIDSLSLGFDSKDALGERSEEQEDRLGHQKYHLQRKPALHPSLTDFGPESLLAFIRHAAQEYDLLQRRAQSEFREYAMFLVNAREGLTIDEATGQRVLHHVEDHKAPVPDANETDKKGKKPIRDSTPASTEIEPAPYAHSQPTEYDLSAAVAPLVCNDGSGGLPKTTQASPVASENLDSVVENRVLADTSVDKETPIEGIERQSTASVTEEITTLELAPLHLTLPSRLSRAASFENHASSTRISQRIRGNRSGADSPVGGPWYRRRKTPSKLPKDQDPSDAAIHHDALDDSQPHGHLHEMKPLLDQESNDAATETYHEEIQHARLKPSSTRKSTDTLQTLPRCNHFEFDYHKCLPEQLPTDCKQALRNRRQLWRTHGLDRYGKWSGEWQDVVDNQGDVFTPHQLGVDGENLLNAPNEDGDYPWDYPATTKAEREPNSRSTQPRDGLPPQFWDIGVLQYLSSTEVRSLRLVSRQIATDLEPHVFRSVVTKFGKSLFNIRPTLDKSGKLILDHELSMLKRHGHGINKFGISFEYDPRGLAYAPFKETETIVDAWFGRYKWPITNYPYFQALKDVDQLLDDERRLLTHALKNLPKCSELAISVDSGHGWLVGPDIGDLALYREIGRGGTRVFGKAFPAADTAHEQALKQFFDWAQVNTVQENIKYLDPSSPKYQDELQSLQRIAVRDYDSFLRERDQPDYEQHLHTGGVVAESDNGQPRSAPNHNVAAAMQHSLYQLGNHLSPPESAAIHTQSLSAAGPSRPHRSESDVDGHIAPSQRHMVQPQWPLIFNGFNLTAECGGDTPFVQKRVAPAKDHPLLPGVLRESQAQWLMETSWIQRTFLSAYIDAVRLNAPGLSGVHSLHISKVSSGLLSSISQKTFWTALPKLRKVTILVIPDWRVEHNPGDKFFQNTMLTKPSLAALKFAELLGEHISRLENLNTLHIGYVGGGEHQKGVFARNQHVLPAPITRDAKEWLLAQNSLNPKPNNSGMIYFPHIRTLTFENCWFSPYMLEQFMHKSRDSSLHNLILDSVSLTAQVNSTRTDGPLRTVDNGLKCAFSPSAWLNETIPANASWVNVLDSITPGDTILDKKYDAHLIDGKALPRQKPAFRGNIQQITLKSCGYVMIMGIGSVEFNQNELVFQNTVWSAMDSGLTSRSKTFSKPATPDAFSSLGERSDSLVTFTTGTWTAGTPASRRGTLSQTDQKGSKSNIFVMQAGKQGHSRSEVAYPDSESGLTAMTGYLTQCIHPIEKRVLERMWGMEFGWGDDMARWEAVEDGRFMGGTGRFSGEVYKCRKSQDAAIEAAQAVNQHELDDRGKGFERLATHASRPSATVPPSSSVQAPPSTGHTVGGLANLTPIVISDDDDDDDDVNVDWIV